METLHITRTTQNMSHIRKRDRLGLTLAGIVIAIIFSLTLLQDGHSKSDVTAGLPRFIETSKTISVDASKEIINVTVITILNR